MSKELQNPHILSVRFELQSILNNSNEEKEEVLRQMEIMNNYENIYMKIIDRNNSYIHYARLNIFIRISFSCFIRIKLDHNRIQFNILKDPTI